MSRIWSLSGTISLLQRDSKGGAKMSAGVRFSFRGILVLAALVSGFGEAARADFLDDIGDFFSNAPEVATRSQCYSYATVAVNFSSDARKNNCPLSGPRYGTDYNSHYFWCMGVTPDTSRAEGQARVAEVDACENHLPFCNVYGDFAAKAAYENKLYNCGFTGPRWGEGREGHRSYCLSSRIAQEKDGYTAWPLPEMSARNDAVKQCKAKNSDQKIAFCNSYGLRAVAHAKTFKEKNCDSSQNNWGRWDSDYDDHFSWCIVHGSLNATAKAGNPETTIRENAVAACLARGGGPAGLVPVVNRNSGAFGPAVRPVGSGVTTTVAPSNSAMDRLGGGIAVSPSAVTRQGRPDVPCPTCGSNRAVSPGDVVRANPVVAPRPTLPAALPAAPRPSVPDRNFDYGGCSGPCGVKEAPLRQPK